MRKKVYLISYLNNYPYLTQISIHNFAETCDDWFHYTDGMYLIASKETMGNIVKMVRAVIGINGKFFVIRLRKGTEYNGYLPKRAWKWIEKYL